MAKKSFGELENAVLRILNGQGRMTVSQVHKKLGEQNSYNTIMTVMLRLCNKKILAREKSNSYYEYWLLTSYEKIPSFIEQLKQKIFGVKAPELMSYLLEATEEITDEEIIEMERLVAKAKESKRMQ
jgi:predicted transcriptional regulator